MYFLLLVYIKQQNLERVNWKVNSAFQKIYHWIEVDVLSWSLSEGWIFIFCFSLFLVNTCFPLSQLKISLPLSPQGSLPWTFLIPRLCHFFYYINSVLFLHSIFSQFVCMCDYFIKVLFPLWEQSVSVFAHQYIHNQHRTYGNSLITSHS